jgi:hypothetical protein
VVDSEDGQTRTSTRVRTDSRARGKALGVTFHGAGFEVSSSDLASVTTYERDVTKDPIF